MVIKGVDKLKAGDKLICIRDHPQFKNGEVYIINKVGLFLNTKWYATVKGNNGLGTDFTSRGIGKFFKSYHEDDIEIANMKEDKLKEEDYKEKRCGDNVNHPPHYTWLKDKIGIEPIDITRHMGFNLGNAIKYILRAGHKKDASMSDYEKELEDLRKANWYIEDRIRTLKERVNKSNRIED